MLGLVSNARFVHVTSPLTNRAVERRGGFESDSDLFPVCIESRNVAAKRLVRPADPPLVHPTTPN